MHIQAGKVKPNPVITSRWGGKCAGCGCKVEPGEQVQFIVPTEVGRGTKGMIKHIDGGCGSQYIIHALYQATRRQIKVSATSAQLAVEVIKKQLTRGRPTQVPWQYEVWQGNVRVMVVES